MRARAAVAFDRVSKAFGGVQAVEDFSLALYPGEVVALLGHNGAGKSTLMKLLAGVHAIDGGEIRVHGEPVQIRRPADAQALGIETIHQSLALADNLDAVANLFLGREWLTPWGLLDELRMDRQAREVFAGLNPNFLNFHQPVRRLSGGQRQTVAIGRALLFNARILVMDEPCAALGPEETAMVGQLIRRLKAQGVAIFLISHDLREVFALADRLCVMKNGRRVGSYACADLSEDEVLGMIIAGRQPAGRTQCEAPPATSV